MKVYYIGTKHGKIKLSFDGGTTFAQVLLDELKKNGYPLPEHVEEEIKTLVEEKSESGEMEISPLSSIVKGVVQDIIKIDTGNHIVQNLDVVNTSSITEDVQEEIRKKINLEVKKSKLASNETYEYGYDGYGYGYDYSQKLVVGIQNEEDITQSLDLSADVVLVLYDKTHDKYSLELQLDTFDPAIINNYEVRLAKVTKRNERGLIVKYSPTGLYIGDLNENQDMNFVEEVLN